MSDIDPPVCPRCRSAGKPGTRPNLKHQTEKWNPVFRVFRRSIKCWIALARLKRRPRPSASSSAAPTWAKRREVRAPQSQAPRMKSRPDLKSQLPTAITRPVDCFRLVVPTGHQRPGSQPKGVDSMLRRCGQFGTRLVAAQVV